MKRFLLLSLIVLAACTPRAPQTPFPAEIPTALPTPVATLITAVPLRPTAEPGSEGNPLILALPPTAHPTDDLIKAANGLSARLETLTGYKFVNVAPLTEKDLLQALAMNNAHVALLSPFGYLVASRQGSASALLSKVRDGQAYYGAQFIARPDEGFKSFFDPDRKENIAEAEQALAQFKNRKPCWSDTASPSGYVVPLGALLGAGVTPRDPAFVQGQPTVVRAVYSRGICDFGATYIDARLLPALEADYPDVLEKVKVIWQTPPVIPYETLVTASQVNPQIKSSLLRAFIDIMNTPDGKLLIQAVYGIDAFQPADDTLYHPFEQYVDASGLDVNTLIR